MRSVRFLGPDTDAYVASVQRHSSEFEEQTGLELDVRIVPSDDYFSNKIDHLLAGDDAADVYMSGPALVCWPIFRGPRRPAACFHTPEAATPIFTAEPTTPLRGQAACTLFNLFAATAFGPAGRFGTNRRPYEDQIQDYTIISGTPKTILPKIRHVLEYIRPGSVFFWDGDGAMTHEDQMRSLRLMGEEVIPAVREMGKELELFSPFEVDPTTGKPLTAGAGAPQPATDSATT